MWTYNYIDVFQPANQRKIQAQTVTVNKLGQLWMIVDNLKI